MKNPQIIAIILIIILLILTSRSTLEDLRLFKNSLNPAPKQEQSKQEQKQNNTKPAPKQTKKTETKKTEKPKTQTKKETPKPLPKTKVKQKKETPKQVKPKQVQTPKPTQKQKVKEPVQKLNYYDTSKDYEFIHETNVAAPVPNNSGYQVPQTNKKSKLPKLQLEVNYTPDNKFSDIKLVPRF